LHAIAAWCPKRASCTIGCAIGSIRAVCQLYALCGLLLLARTEGVTLAHSLSLKPGAVIVRDGDYMFDTPAVRAIVLVFANDLPTRLRERRAEVYEYFNTR